MRTLRRHPFIVAAAVLAVVGSCLRAPWVQGANTSGADASLGLAPVWTTAFRNFQGARVDLRGLATEIFLSLALVGMIALGQALRRS